MELMDSSTIATEAEHAATEPAVGDVSAGGPMPELLDGPGQVEPFFQSLPEDKQMTYIMMLAPECIEGFNVKEMHPYSVFMTTPKLGGGGWIRKLKPNKDLVVQELKRRDPYARPNKNNRAADEMMQLFTPLTDPRDVAFVTMKELEFRQKMINMLKECEDAKKEVRRCSLSTPSKRPRVDYSNAYAGSVEGGGMYIQPNGSLSMHAAKAVLEAAEEYAARCKWKVSIAIVDAVGNPMYVKRMEDAFPGSFEMAIGKAKRAVHFKQLNGSGAGDAKGSLAIIIDDVCCAGIGVAGESAKPDAIAAEGINALRNLAEMQEPGEAKDV